MKLTDKTLAELIQYLLDHETDIAYSINDFGSLQNVFVEFLGREAQK